MVNADQIFANGGVIVKCDEDNLNMRLYAIVHRPAYDDWTFPKGKIDLNEEPLDCALREVFEETGYVTRPIGELGSTSYSTNATREKIVKYWLLEIENGQFKANEEVDAIAWLPNNLISRALTYEQDIEIAKLAALALEDIDK